MALQYLRPQIQNPYGGLGLKTPCKHGDWKDLPPCPKPLFYDQVVKGVLAKYEALERDLEELDATDKGSIAIDMPLENIEET